jgi:hypothetical protein
MRRELDPFLSERSYVENGTEKTVHKKGGSRRSEKKRCVGPEGREDGGCTESWITPSNLVVAGSNPGISLQVAL